jgi:RNA recognition motif-containing protein
MIGALRTVHRLMRSADSIIGLNVRINMNSYSTGKRSHRSRGGSRRRGNGHPRRQRQETKEPKKSFWQRIAAFFGNGTTKEAPSARNGAEPSRSARKPERIEVSSPRLYVGNLSFDATESDLFDLFNGVGHVQNAEIVSYRHNQRSKGFAFVQMQTIEEAKRAVEELHDKEFLGRRLVVSGAKSGEHRAR